MRFGSFDMRLSPPRLAGICLGLLLAALLHAGWAADANAQGRSDAAGEAWRGFRDGPAPTYGLWGIFGMLGLLALFFLLRGRIKIEHGWAGYALIRFKLIERLGHWLLAISFIILALTGLNGLYGRYALLPILGADTFAAVSQTAKWLHTYVAFAFMIGLALTFVLWVAQSFPTLTDIKWLLRGGGLLTRGSHPPAWRFNAGQKILFWLVMVGGLALSLSGLALLLPFQTALFAKTFALLNMVGFDLPASLSPVREMEYAASWHGIVALFLTIVIIAHIYIRTLGMQGAFDAMGSGEVDLNWAREHHSLWAEQELKRFEAQARPRVAPAE